MYHLERESEGGVREFIAGIQDETKRTSIGASKKEEPQEKVEEVSQTGIDGEWWDVRGGVM